MKICVVAHFYPPEACAAATRVLSLARSLAASGHSVTVVTNFPTFPTGMLQQTDRWRVIAKNDSEGVRVVRLFTRTFRGLPLARLWQWTTSALAMSAFVLGTRERYDIIVVSLPPITLTLPALVGAWRHRAKLVVDVRDVYPDIAIAMGEWHRNSFFARAAEIAARMLYRRANLIAAVTPTALRQIALRGVDSRRLLLAPNGCEDVPLRQRTANGRSFTALYAGNLGLATDVDVLVDAAALLQSDGITIEIAGDGAEGPRMRERVRRAGLRNVVFAGSVSRTAALKMLARADVSIVPLRKGIEESVPTKLWDALSTGCPVVLAAEGEACDAARASGGAVCVPAGDAQALASAIRQLSGMDKSRLREMGLRGREFVVTHYRRSAIMGQFSDRISRV